MISALEIKQKLSLVSMGKLSLNAFEDWLVPRAWNVHKDSSREAVELVSSIHLLMSERDDNVLNEADLHHSLLELLNDVIYVPISFADRILTRAPVCAVPVVKGMSNPIEHTVSYEPDLIASWVTGWSARPAQLALKHVQV
jgi:hypothetical protein